MHEDEDGYLFFYDAILDKSSWEHPQEGYWKRRLEDERRKAVRHKEVRSIEDQIATMAEGEEGKQMLRELKARFIKADVAALEVQMQSTRSQVETLQLTLTTNAPDEEGRTREQVRKHCERLKKELRGLGEMMRGMLSRLEKVMRPEDDDTPDEHLDQDAAPKTDVLVTPEAIKEMCEYLGINIYTEPHLISIAKAALEAPLPAGWVESVAPDGTPGTNFQSAQYSDFFHSKCSSKTLTLKMVIRVPASTHGRDHGRSPGKHSQKVGATGGLPSKYKGTDF